MRNLFVLFIMLSIVFVCMAETMAIPIAYSVDQFKIKGKQSEKIYIDRGTIGGTPGNPQITQITEHVLLPPYVKIESVKLDNLIWDDFFTGDIYPAQTPSIFSIQNPGTTEPNMDSYSQNRWFPEKPILSYNQGNLSGFNLLGLNLSPIRYNPTTKLCQRLASADLKIEYSTKFTEKIAPSKRTENGALLWSSIIDDLVLNPQAKSYYSVDIDPEAYDWVVFLPSSYTTWFSGLVDLRRSWGLRDTIITLETVYASYSGIDDAERLRNAISDLFTEKGISYVLLIGDEGVAPSKITFAMESDARFYEDEDRIRADLYFSDLDGNWNFDEDTTWGEIEDSVDMYPEVMIGRLPVNYASGLIGVIDKISNYENLPGGDFPYSGLMIGQELWLDPYTDGGLFKDELAEEVFPDGITFKRVYGRDGGTANDALDSLDFGPNVINHAGHAGSSVICVDHGSCIWLTDMDLLTNANRPSIMFSIGCWPAAFDKNCIAEHYINNGSGGGAAFVGNSRYGWGSPGNSGWGYSEVLDRAFWQEIYNGNIFLGQALNLSKIRYIPLAQWENVWRWVVYQVNILGDPATAVITGAEDISMEYEIEGSNVSVRVTLSDGVPASDCQISVYDDSGLIDAGKTDVSGHEVLSISDAVLPTYITARYGSEAFVAETLATLAGDGFFRFEIDNSLGFADGQTNPGDTIMIDFTIGGFSSDITGLSWSPSSIYGSPIDVVDPPCTLSSADSASFSATYVLPASFSMDTTLVMDPNISYSDGIIGFPISINLNLANIVIDGAILQNSDANFDPGETAHLMVRVINRGDGFSGNNAVYLTCPGGEIDIVSSLVNLPTIDPQDTANIGPFEISWASGAEIKPVVKLNIEIESMLEDTIYLATQKLGFKHDAETSDDPFTKGDPSHMWHRDNRRANSGSYSWCCGDYMTASYWPDMNDWIVSDPMVIGENSELSFWAFLSFPNYGSDGLYVEVMNSSETVTLDYLGSGGALLSFIVGWSEYRYSLESTPFEPGDTIQVKFRFKSDSDDQAEGVFIDDIELKSGQSIFVTTVTEDNFKPENIHIGLSPNPFNSALKISFRGNVDANSRLAIFDISGRLVKEFSHSDFSNESNQLIWNGTDKTGNNCASGVYFIRLIQPNRVITSRAVLLK